MARAQLGFNLPIPIRFTFLTTIRSTSGARPYMVFTRRCCIRELTLALDSGPASDLAFTSALAGAAGAAGVGVVGAGIRTGSEEGFTLTTASFTASVIAISMVTQEEESRRGRMTPDIA